MKKRYTFGFKIQRRLIVDLKVAYQAHIFVDPYSQKKRVAFGPSNYHFDPSLGEKSGATLYENRSCLQRLFVILRNIFLHDVIILTDVQNKKLAINKIELGKWVWQQSGNIRPLDNKALIEAINQICSHLKDIKEKKQKEIKTEKVQLIIKKDDIPKHTSEPKQTTVLKTDETKLKEEKKETPLKDNSIKQHIIETPRGSKTTFADLLRRITEPDPDPKEKEKRKAERRMQKEGIIKIQSAVRMHQAKRTYRLDKERKTDAATAIQSAYRMHQSRKTYKELKRKLADNAENQKTYAIAKEHFASFTKFCYQKDGVTLNNYAERKRFWRDCLGVLNDPDKKRKKAAELRKEESESAKAAELEKKADALDKKREKRYKAYQRTLFPHEVDHYTFNLEDVFRDANQEDQIPTTVYHGTNEYAAAKIRHEGFASEIITRRILDSGSGVYFTLDKETAKGYAQNEEENVLECKINPGRVAVIKEYKALWSLVEHFFAMSDFYVQKHKEQLFEQLEKIKPDIRKEYLPFVPIREHLRNEITRVFFQKLGYDSVYVPFSSRAGCGYINVLDLDPSKKRIEILN